MSGSPVYLGHDPNDLKNLIIIGVWNSGYQLGEIENKEEFEKAKVANTVYIKNLLGTQNNPSKILTILQTI